MITQKQLKRMLDRMEPWNFAAGDWRKLQNGKIVRFVDWSRIAKSGRSAKAVQA